jgi:hypothetical protein
MGASDDQAIDDSFGMRRAMKGAAPGLVIAGSLAVLCLIQSGASLSTFICGLVIVVAMVPAMTLARRNWTSRLIASGSVTDSIAITWLVLVFVSPISFWQWLGAYVAMLAFALALSGVAMMLASLRLDRVIAATVTSILGFAWLSWPVWLSPHLQGETGVRVAGALVFAHPIFALNALLSPPLEIWTHMPVMYRLTTLGQDLAYQLPGGIAWCIAIHGFIGATGLFIATRPKAVSKEAQGEL